ncbi:glucose-1-phosphate adenylyltransferase family protein [Tabrizicola sp.]|uniref:glucose-1-phosphate adenylyltransferase family protein n=1 Tax=Tabrizicola sp. TaxID=2005166 RepID=UPI0025FC3257|nr:sugar phosphate nucleotidyltransferase [Tabrizicola sp.]
MTVTPELTDTVAIVLAGGRGTRLHELTSRDCKPVLPFARFHRIVDFTMAALARSGVPRVMVGTQYRPESLTSHLREVWGPVWPEGALMLRDGVQAGAGSYRGTADVLRANAAELDALGTREVLVVAADHVYSMDYRGFIDAHRESGAPLTLAAMPVLREDAGRFGIVTEGPGHRIAGFAEKPDQPAAIFGDPQHSLASLGIYVVDWAWLRDVLADPNVLDFGEDVIPLAVHSGEAAVWRWDGYWRDVGTLDGLRQSWLDFEDGPPPCRRPLVPGMKVRMQAATLPRDAFTSSVNLGGLRLMSPMVGSGNPDRWTALDRSVLMPGARVSPGVRLTNVIVGPNTVIPHGMHIGDDPEEDGRWFRVSGDTTLVSSAMLARRGALRTPVFSLFHGGPTLPRKVQGAQ